MKTKTNEKRRLHNEKWRNIPLFLFLFSFFISFAGCSNDDLEQEAINPPAANTGDITFTIGFAPQMQTRVATDAQFNSTWETDDAIGLFAVKRAANNTTATLQASGNYMHNVKLTYDGSKWAGAAYYASDDEVLDFYAYYPYIDNATIDPANITFAVQTNQSGTAYNKSDLLMANKVTGIAKGDAVSLQFKHILSLVQVEVPTGTMTGSGPNESLEVHLPNVIAATTLNLGDESLTAGSKTQSIQMHRVEADPATTYTYTYRALVPGQDIAKGSAITYMQDARNYMYALPAQVSLAQGFAKRYAIEMPASAIHSVLIKAGTFQMGSPDSDTQASATEKPRHWVKLTQDYRMSKYEITNAQYAAFLNAVNVGKNGQYKGNGLIFDSSQSGFSPWGLQWDTDKWVSHTGYENHPVIYVSWYGAMEFATWLGGSLPTEAQWEYACRAGTETIYSFEGDANKLGDYAWYNDNSGSETHAVGTKKSNPWGLHDMHGNVFEWCRDQWDRSNNYPTNATTESKAVVDPLVEAGIIRVVRGGSWRDFAQYCRSAYRYFNTPFIGNGLVGFRVVFPLSSL